MPEQIDMALGRRLADLRHAKGFSRETLAASLSTSVRRIAAFEEGRARMSVADIVGLSAALGTPIAGLFADLRPGNIVVFPGEPTPAEGHALLSAFLKIRDARARSSLLQMAEYLTP